MKCHQQGNFIITGVFKVLKYLSPSQALQLSKLREAVTLGPGFQGTVALLHRSRKNCFLAQRELPADRGPSLRTGSAHLSTCVPACLCYHPVA